MKVYNVHVAATTAPALYRLNPLIGAHYDLVLSARSAKKKQTEIHRETCIGKFYWNSFSFHFFFSFIFIFIFVLGCDNTTTAAAAAAYQKTSTTTAATRESCISFTFVGLLLGAAVVFADNI